jgi:iron complex outermembrane recepter protein
MAAAVGCAHAQSTQTLDPVVVTASKIEEPQGQATAIVDVIDRQQIEQSGAANISELLDQVSGGLLTRQYGRLGADASFDLGYLGGAAVQRTLVLVDGVRMNDIDDSTIRWGQVPLDAIERIEVRKAGGGVLFGDRAMGGVVNIITKRTPESNAAAVTLGSFGMRVLGVQISRQIQATSLQIAAQQAKTDGYRADSEQDLRSLNLRLSQQTQLGQFGLQIRSAYENILQPYSIPLATFQANPKAASTTSPTRSKRRGTNTDLVWQKDLSADWSTTVRWSREQSNSQANYLYQNDRDSLDWTSVLRAFGGRLVTGVEWFDAESASNRSQRASVTQTSTAAYVNLEKPIAASLLNIGLRHQRMQNNFYNSVGSAAEKSTKGLTGWSMGGLSPLAWGELRYSLQSSFAFPTADQLYTFDSSFNPKDIYPGVEPMRSNEAQVSLDKKISAATLRAGIRYIRINDEIGFKSDCSGTDDCNDNLYDTSRAIIFLEGRGRLSHRIQWQTSVDRVESEIRSGSNTGKQVPMVPTLVAKGSLSWKRDQSLYRVVANHRGQMVQSGDDANTYFRIPARLTLDAGYSYAWSTQRREISLWVRNITNKQYFDFASFESVAPADGRSVELRVKQDF